MASIKYSIRKKKDNAKIYVRVIISKSQDYKKKLGVIINPKYWNANKGMPKQTNENGKLIYIQLQKLTAYLSESINNNKDIDSEKLSFLIDVFFGRRKNKEIVSFNDFCNSYVEEINERRGRDVTLSTYKKYKSIANKIQRFDPNNKYKIEDVDLNYKKRFEKFLREVDKISENTIGRYVKFLKTFLLEAEKRGFKLHDKAKLINGYTVKSEKIILSFKELEQLKQITLSGTLQTARDWLLISCYTGQRVSDLLRMDKSMIKEVQGFYFIEITQKKTKKTVQIPIHNAINHIITDGFPPLFIGNGNIESESVEYNELLKGVCRVAGIDKLTLGNLYDKEQKRFIKKEYPKYKLISSHIGRRSFATNFYGKYPTPLLMNCTGHSTEKMFLEYVGKPSIDSGLELAKLWS